MSPNYYSEPQIWFCTYSFIIFANFYTICHQHKMSAETLHMPKKLIQITKISVGTSTTLAMLLIMPQSHTSLSKITCHKTKQPPWVSVLLTASMSMVCCHGWFCGWVRESGLFIWCSYCVTVVRDWSIFCWHLFLHEIHTKIYSVLFWTTN